MWLIIIIIIIIIIINDRSITRFEPCTDERIDILRVLMRLLASDSRTKNYFREVTGFVYVLSTLITLAHIDEESHVDCALKGKYLPSVL